MKRFYYLLAVFALLFSSIGFAYTVETVDKLTIVKFSSEELPNSVIKEELGWQLDCLIETPPFEFSLDYDAELQVILDISGAWEQIFKNAVQAAVHHLAAVELTYLDRFGAEQFVPMMIQPSHFGAIEAQVGWSPEHAQMHGGDLEKRHALTHGPLTIPAGAKNLSVGLCDIAPSTSFRVHEIQFRIRPLN
jgi:hypothetical protein